MKRNKVFKASLFMYIIPIILGVLFYKQMPETMAVHFDSDGVANSFLPKYLALFGLPLFIMVIEIVSYYVTTRDPRKEYQGDKILNLTLIFLPLLAIGESIYMILYSLGTEYNIIKIVYIVLGVFLVLIGNYLPKTRRNYTIGIKLPWTLNNDDNWDKTHKLAGYLWVLGGVLILISNFILQNNIYVIFGVIFVIVVIPVIYSYVIYNKNLKK